MDLYSELDLAVGLVAFSLMVLVFIRKLFPQVVTMINKGLTIRLHGIVAVGHVVLAELLVELLAAGVDWWELGSRITCGGLLWV